MLRSIFFIVSFILIHLNASGQTSDILEALRQRLKENSAENKQQGIYLHTDKSVYTANEHIWFTGYIFTSGKHVREHHTLYVILVNLLTGDAEANERFILNEGISKGQIMIADSIPAGEYKLLAYSNTFLQDQSEPIFVQTVTIRSPYKEDISILVDSFETGDPGKLTIVPKVTSVKWGLPAGGQMRYTLYSGNKKIREGKEKIDNSGNVRIQVPDSLANSKLELTGEINYKKEDHSFRKAFDLPFLPIRIRFFPEGGNLVDGHLTRMAFEISAGGKALAVAGTLLKDGVPVAGFQSDKYGLGSTQIVPAANAEYSVILEETRKHVLHTEFPKIVSTGFSISVENAVGGDTLYLILQPPSPNTECIVLLHRQQKEYFNAVISVKGSKGLLKIPVWELPDGVATITVFNNKGIPVAERAVFLKQPGVIVATMSPDSASYSNRSKVTLKVKITDEESQPVVTTFSFACVLSSRIDSSRYSDIARYFYFDRYLPQHGVLPPAHFFSEKKNIDHLLLTRFWTRYRWNELASSPASKTYLGNFGHVKFRQKTPKSPVDLMVFGDLNIMQIQTDSSGRFLLPSEILQGEADSKLLVSVVDKKWSADYELLLGSDLGELDRQLIERPFLNASIGTDDLSVSEKKEKTLLQGVTVQATRTLDGPGVFRSVNCNDYVCIYNILNCENHPLSRSKPVTGGLYFRRNDLKKVETVTYVGCDKDQKKETSFLKQIKATNAPKEFYRADYIKFNPEDKEDFTTVFWSHQIETNEHGEAEITFFTNDLRGNFVCILQGIADGLPVTGRTYFQVK